MKKCPPGLICVNNYVICATIIVIIIFVFIQKSFTQTIILNNQSSVKTEENKGYGYSNGWFSSFIPSFPYNNLPYNHLPYNHLPNDVLLNPYAPPLRDERAIMAGLSSGMIPINVATNVGAVDTNYRQLGFLSPMNNKEKLIALMGRPVYTNRNKWQYYTMSDQQNSIKLPVLRGGRSCMTEYGCDGLYSGDIVQVDGLNSHFKVTLYENDAIKYLPFL